MHPTVMQVLECGTFEIISRFYLQEIKQKK